MFKNVFKTAALLAFLGALFMGVGAVLGGTSGLLIGLVIGLAFCGGSYWFSDKLALRGARAQPLSREQAPGIYALVEDLSSRAGIPMPRLYISPEQQPNAFATGRNPKHAVVCVTDGITKVLTEDELRGVLAHELAHVRHRDILIGSVAAAVALAITFGARMAFWFGSDDDNFLAGLLMMILAPIAAILIQMAISRSFEFNADADGARILGTGEPLARALEKIEGYARRVPMDVNPAQASLFIMNPFTGRRIPFGNLFSTHPPTDERIRRLLTLTPAR